MKKLFILTTIVATSLIATKSYSQVYVGARIGFRVPGARVVIAAPAPVVYGDAYAPAPAYGNAYAPAPAPAYDGGYYAPPAQCEAEFPGYAYYDYPAWYGHYRDRVYFSHYRPYFERDHRGYFNRGHFDRGRFDHDRGYHRGRW